MSHSVEAIYAKAALIQEKGLTLHRERFKKQGDYDEHQCQLIFEDMKALALELAYSDCDFDIDFAQDKKVK